MQTILRLESIDGWGIYAMYVNGISTEAVTLVNKIRDVIRDFYGCLGSDQHPNPRDDSLLWAALSDHGLSPEDVRYGFSDNAQFRAWFPEDELLRKLDELGVTLACYSVETLLLGHAQSATPKLGELQWRKTLGEYFFP